MWHKRGFDFGVKNRQGKNCVFAACKFGHAVVLDKLHNYGVSLITEKPNGMSVLLYPMCRGNTDAFLYLLRYYIDRGQLENVPDLVKSYVEIICQMRSV